MSNTLDLLTQVLFVALMAMLLYVLYRRFIAMLSKGRISGSYARVVELVPQGTGVALTLDSADKTVCTVTWGEGQSVELTCEQGISAHWIEMDLPLPTDVTLTFGNQTVRRRISA